MSIVPDPKEVALLQAMLLEAKRVRFGTIKVEVIQDFEVDVRDGKVVNWACRSLPRMSIQQVENVWDEEKEKGAQRNPRAGPV